MIGQRIADRYELLEEGQRALGGRLFRARDLAFGEIVAVKMIGSGAAASPGLRQLEAEIRRLQRSAQPSFVRHYTLDATDGVLIREWVNGFSLLELIKRRHELPAEFALRLLDGLPAIFDFTATEGISLPRQLLAKLLVRFDDKIAPEQVATTPIEQWPPFALKLNPISVREALSDSDGETTMTTIDLHSAGSDQKLAAPARLAQLLYEVLGGPIRSGGDRRYTPLPALHEEGNGVLRRALLEAPYRDCKSLWSDLVRAEPNDLRPAISLPAPAEPADPAWTLASSSQPEPATLLKLLPKNLALPAIHLVAQPKFTLGRSLFHADFITRFLPANPGNDDLTNQLSRVHVLAERSGRKLTIRDGNGDTASVNGTALDDQSLESDSPTALRQRSLLTLGGVYSLEVTPRLTTAPAPLKIPELRDDAIPHPTPPPEVGGAVFFFPIQRQPVVRHAVWIFSRAGFGLDTAQHIVWDLRGHGASPAAFFHERGCFWIGNLTLPPGAITIEDRPLAPSSIAPLNKGRSLRIGSLDFTIELA